ncbi:MAG: tetratricopeptide repeat protein [Rikenellaceae bacterium]
MRYILTIVVTLFTLSLSAQELPERSLVRKGNRAYNKNEFKKAIESYDKAYSVAPESFEVLYNYANALHKDEQYAKAEELYASMPVDSLATDADRADLFYNLGNSQFMQQKYQEALESYKSSIRLNHEDQEAKYNYAYTKKLLEDQENEGGGGGDDQNQDQNQDQDQDQNGEGDQNQDQNDGGDQEQDPGDGEQDQNQGDGEDEQEQPQQPQSSEGKISPQEQQQMLDAIQAQEDKTQEKLEEKGKGVVVRGRKNW